MLRNLLEEEASLKLKLKEDVLKSNVVPVERNRRVKKNKKIQPRSQISGISLDASVSNTLIH